MDFTKGSVVVSKAGRDKGYLLAVVGSEKDFVLVADGKERPLERRKRKNPSHPAKTAMTVSLENITDRELRRVLRHELKDKQECE